MTNNTGTHKEDALIRLRCFLQGGSQERLYKLEYTHPHRPEGLCCCGGSRLETARIYLRGALMEFIFKLPSNSLKVKTLRLMGVKVGRNVYLGHAIVIDPVYTYLLEIGDDVYIGADTHIYTHEFRRNEFRAGKTTIGTGAFIGSHAIIGCGVDIGENATVAAAAALDRDVPAGYTAIGNPARIVNMSASSSNSAECK